MICFRFHFHILIHFHLRIHIQYLETEKCSVINLFVSLSLATYLHSSKSIPLLVHSESTSINMLNIEFVLVVIFHHKNFI